MGRRKRKMELAVCPVHYDDLTHTYTYDGRELSGITSMLKRTMFYDKYAGIPASVLDKAAERGSDIHNEVSMFEIGGVEPSTQEGKNYVEYIKPMLDVVASEYLISDNVRYASAIDLVSRSDNSSVDLIDIKTPKAGPDIRYTTWQLSCYAKMFEDMNPKIKVNRLICLWLSEGHHEMTILKRIPSDVIQSLMDADANDLPFDDPYEDEGLVKEDENMTQYISFEQEYIRLTERIKELDEMKKKALDAIVQVLDQNEWDKIETEHLTFTKVKPSTRTTVDGTRLKAEMPDVYQKYSKVSNVKGTIKVALKK